MAELDRAGIQLVVEGLQQVLSNVSTYNKTVLGAGKASQTAAKQITDLGVKWQEAARTFQLTGKTKGAPAFVNEQKALQAAINNTLNIMRKTGREIAGIKFDIGSKKFIDSLTGAEVSLKVVRKRVEDFGLQTGTSMAAAARVTQESAQRISSAWGDAISKQRQMIAQHRAQAEALSQQQAAARQAAQSQQAANSAAQQGSGFLQRLGASIQSTTRSTQAWIMGSRGTQAALQAQARSAQQAGQAAQQMGINWQQLGRDLRSAQGDTSKTAKVLSDALKQIGVQSQAVQKGLTSSNARVQAAALALAKAQIAVAKTQKDAIDAAQKAAQAQGQNAQANAQAEEALRSYQNALTKASIAQANFNKSVQQAKPPPILQQFQQVGKTVQQGFQTAQNAIQGAIGLVTKFIVVLGIAKVASLALHGALNLIRGAFNLLISPITRAINALQTLFRASAIIAFGVLIRDTIRGIIRDLKEMAASALEAVTAFQTLTLRLEIMESRMLRDMDATLDFTTAMRMGEERAQGLVRWIKELSLTAPFDVGVIGNTLSLNLAMGFMETQAKDLTQAILGYTAAMGLGPEIMERITFNLGQMKAAGKVTATEMRDLARGAFFPLTRVLDIAAEKLGIAGNSLQQFRKDAAEGKIDVNTFFEAFITMVQRDFPNAVEKFGQTLTGVRQRLINFFKTIIGLELLAPIGKRIAGALNNILDILLSPEVAAGARMIGEVLNRSFGLLDASVRSVLRSLRELATALGFVAPSADQLAFSIVKIVVGVRQATTALSNFIRDIAERVEERFDNVKNSMQQFGYNAIVSFARGMLRAVSVILRVIRYIASVITGLFKATSPPKILPKLPEWGMKAMESWLEGFTMADFDVLEDVQDPIERVLQLFVETGKLSEKKFGKVFVGISESITKVLSGDLSASKLFDQIRKNTGKFASSIIELTKREIELGRATDRVREAEERLERARQRERDLRQTLNKQIFEYNQRVREGATREELQGRLKVINATARSAAKATKQVSLEEERLELAKKQVEIWEEQVRLQQRLIDQLIKLTEAQIVQPEQPETLAGGGAGGAEDILEDLGGLEPIDMEGILDEEEMKKRIDRFFANARVFIRFQWLKFKQAIEKELEQAGIDLDAAIKGITDAFNAVRTWWGENGPGIISDTHAILTNLGKVLEQDGKSIRESIRTIFGVGEDEDAFREIWRKVLQTISFFIAGFVGAYTMLLSGIASIKSGIDTFALSAQKFGDALQNIFDILTLNIFETDPQVFIDKFLQFSDDIITAVAFLGLGIFKVITGWLKIIFGPILGFVRGILELAMKLADDLVYKSIIPDMMQAIYDSVVGTLTEILASWMILWQAAMDFLRDKVAKPIDDFKNRVLTNLRNFVQNDLTNALNAFRTGVLQPISTFFTTTLPKAIDTFLTKAKEIGTTISGEITRALNTFRTNVLQPLVTGFSGIVTAIKNVISWVDTLIAKIAKIKIPKVINPDSPTPFEVGLRGISDALRQVARVELPALTSNLNSLPVSRPSVSAPPLSMAGAQSFSNSVSVNMGGVSIMNGMDEAQFEARVLHVVRKGMGFQ